MKVHPETMKQYLQLTLLNGSNGLSSLGLPGAGSNASQGPDFAQMLDGLLMMQSQSTAVTVDSTASLSSLQRLAGGGVQPAGDQGQYDEIIDAASQRYGVDRSLIKAVIQAESSYNENAVSSAGAKGLMQLMDGTAEGLGVQDSFDPDQNIHGGTRFLAWLLDRYDGQEAMALAAYNAGPGRVDRLGVRTDDELMASLTGLPKETQRYIGKVQGYKAYY